MRSVRSSAVYALNDSVGSVNVSVANPNLKQELDAASGLTVLVELADGMGVYVAVLVLDG